MNCQPVSPASKASAMDMSEHPFLCHSKTEAAFEECSSGAETKVVVVYNIVLASR